MSANRSSRRAQLGIGTPIGRCLTRESRGRHDGTKRKRPHKTAILHPCKMPYGYYAPRAFPKLFYESVVFGSSRQRSADFFIGLLRETIISCGRCGIRLRDIIWTREDVESLFDLARAKGRDHLERRIYRDYDDRVLACSACNRAAHLAWDGLTPDDLGEPF